MLLLLLLNHVVIIAKLCSVDGFMEDKRTSNKHSQHYKSLLWYIPFYKERFLQEHVSAMI